MTPLCLKGSQRTIDDHKHKIQSDPATGELGELGFGTQLLPVSGRDIQDEKILGTLHVATGRSDHLGGHLTPDKFQSSKNATHDDILFAPHKTPEINVPQVRMHRNGKTEVLIENFPTGSLHGESAGLSRTRFPCCCGKSSRAQRLRK